MLAREASARALLLRMRAAVACRHEFVLVDAAHGLVVVDLGSEVVVVIGGWCANACPASLSYEPFVFSV